MQAKVMAIVAAGIPEDRIGAVVGRHPRILWSAIETSIGTLDFVAEVLEVPVSSSELTKFVLGAHNRLFTATWSTQQAGLACLTDLGL